MDKICSFLNQSVSPYHAVKQVKEALKVAGFQSLEEENLWQLEPGKNYYVTRHTLIACSIIIVLVVHNVFPFIWVLI